MSDRSSREIVVFGNPSTPPRTIFLSMRGTFNAIPAFVQYVLPKIVKPFVLVSGSADFTIPQQVDSRWRVQSHSEQQLAYKLSTDERVIHWFIENRDAVMPKTSSLPTGHVFGSLGDIPFIQSHDVSPLADRPAKILCAHREREGTQWNERQRVSELCKREFASFATFVESELSYKNFVSTVRAHPFTLCVAGGGLDPSPKAWTAIANGSIPIIKSSPLDDAYSQLPIVTLDDWRPDSITPRLLDQWIEIWSPDYEIEDRRRNILYKLTLAYWWNQIFSRYLDGKSN